MAAAVVVRGLGSIGQRHARVMLGLGADVRVWPVRPRPVTPDEPVPGARRLEEREADRALADADLVIVATDTGRHVTDTLAALDAGAPRVLVEKPVAPSVADARRLLAHPRSADVWVAAPLRATEAFRALPDPVHAVGQPLHAHVWCQSWLPAWHPERDYRESYSARAAEGGVLRDLVHEIDYALALFGPAVLAGGLVAHGGPLDIASEQAATLLWSTAQGATVTVRLDYTSRPPARGMIARGPDGELSWDLLRGVVRRRDARGRAHEQAFPADLDRDVTTATQARAALAIHPSAPSAEARTAGAPATLAEAMAALAVCDAARRLAGGRSPRPAALEPAP